jgi:hypothetical protein
MGYQVPRNCKYNKNNQKFNQLFLLEKAHEVTLKKLKKGILKK